MKNHETLISLYSRCCSCDIGYLHDWVLREPHICNCKIRYRYHAHCSTCGGISQIM